MIGNQSIGQPSATQAKRARPMILLMALLPAIAIGLLGCDPSAGEVETAQGDNPPAVRAATVREAPALDWQRFPGVLRAQSRSRPAFLHPGTLAERRVSEGDQVARGEILAILHNPALGPAATAAQGRVDELNSNIRQYEQDLARAQALNERELIADEEVDRLQSRLDAAREARKQAQAQRDEAQEQLAELQLRAPFAGQVVAVMAEAGDFLNAGQPVLQLAGEAGLEVAIQLPSTLADGLDRDSPVQFSRPLQGGRFPGRIVRLGRGGESMVTAVIEPIDHDTTPPPAAGQVVHVHLGRRHGGETQLPLAAVMDPGGQDPSVYRLVETEQGMSVERVAVAVGRLRGDWVAVSEGVEIGDRVVVAGQSRLVAGEPVRVLP